MNIERINSYHDPRFSQRVLNQHGCFLAEGEPYEVEIISDTEAMIRGENPELFPEIIEVFRFYTPHISVYYDENRRVVKHYPAESPLSIPISAIQPSQFYVDADKIQAVSSFIHRWEDIVIQVIPWDDDYISADGHTRLYYAVMQGWTHVRAVVTRSDPWLLAFAEEAIRREIQTPSDLKLVDHQEYEEKWNKFCDNFFAQKGRGASQE